MKSQQQSARPLSLTPPYLTPAKKNNTKSVTFNEITEEIYYENDVDRTSLFYNAYDYQVMKEQRLDDIADILIDPMKSRYHLFCSSILLHVVTGLLGILK